MLPDVHPEAGAVVELLGALLASEAPLPGVEGVAVRLQVRLEGEAPEAETALVTLHATDRLGVLRVLAAFRTLWHLIERCKMICIYSSKNSFLVYRAQLNCSTQAARMLQDLEAEMSTTCYYLDVLFKSNGLLLMMS